MDVTLGIILDDGWWDILLYRGTIDQPTFVGIRGNVPMDSLVVHGTAGGLDS